MTNKNDVQPTEGTEDALVENILPFASRAQHRQRKSTSPTSAGPGASDACVPLDDDPGPTAA